jgi:hypothetical protein
VNRGCGGGERGFIFYMEGGAGGSKGGGGGWRGGEEVGGRGFLIELAECRRAGRGFLQI